MQISLKGKYDHATRKEIKYVLNFWAKILLGERLSENVSLTVTFTPLSSDTLGCCGPSDWGERYHREFEFFIEPSISKEKLFQVLSHEMEHLRQFARGELKSGHGGDYRWKGQTYTYPKTKKEHRARPWEVEARRSERYLVDFYRKHIKMHDLKFAS